VGESEHDQPERQLLAAARRDAIAQKLRDAGSITVAEIEQRFEVSSMTARRDLAELERRGVARRTHGGATQPVITAHEDAFASRVDRGAEAKLALAVRAAATLTMGETVFLDGSSSALYLAREMVNLGTRATVITNSLPIAELIGRQPTDGLELVAVGGTLRRLTQSFVGPLATRTIDAQVADRLFFSAKGVTRDGLVTDADVLEADLKRRMIERAGESTLLIDSTKLGTRGLNVIARLGEVDTVLAHGLADDELSALAAAGPRVVPVEAA
jgi:DeoR/GlpR family transcriptional regulator of sugar metabolism